MITGRTRNAAERGQSIDEVAAVARNLAGTDEIRSVHIVSGERPTYDDLLRYRRWADVSHLNLVVEATSIAFRSCQRSDEVAPLETIRKPLWPYHIVAHDPWRAGLNAYSQGVKPAIAENSVGAALSWLSAHGRAWYSEFMLMSEGTR